MVPVDTMAGLLDTGGKGCDVLAEMAWSSGVLEMMAEALLMSEGLIAEGTGLAGGEATCLSGGVGIVGFVTAAVSAVCLRLLVDGACFTEGGEAKASSASRSTTLWLMSLGFGGGAGSASSKSNLAPLSCSREN